MNPQKAFAQQSPFCTPEQTRSFLDGLRRAGVPDWPNGFQRDEGDRLTGAELAAVAANSSSSGRLGDGRPFQRQSDAEGVFSYRTDADLVAGRQFLRADQLCQVFRDRLSPGEICGSIYRASSLQNPELDFVFVSIDDTAYFSAVD